MNKPKGENFMKSEKLKNIYSNPPQDFHNAILCALVKLDDKAPVRYKRRRALKIAVVCAIILALCTSSVFAAEKVWSLFSKPVDNYGLNVVATSSADNDDNEVPEYIKLVLSYLPEGVIETPNTGGRKYSLNGEAKEMWFTFDITKINSDFENTIGFISDSYETIVNGNRVIVFNRTLDDNGDNNQKGFYEYFEKWGMLVSCLCDDITDEELNKVIEGVSLAEGSEDDHFYIADSDEEIPTKPLDEHGYEDNYSYTIGELNKPFDYSTFSMDDSMFSINVKSVEVHDNANDLNSDDFYFDEYEQDDGNGVYSTYFNSDGSIISPYIHKNIIEGDGINSINHIEEETLNRHLVLVTMDVTALGEVSEGEPYAFGIFESLRLYNLTTNSNGKLVGADDYPVSGAAVYVSSTGKNNLYNAHISKGETETITVGFFVDEDKMEDLYFTIMSTNLDLRIDGEDYYLDRSAVCFKVEG